MDCDVVIVGCGVAGLYAALNLPATSRVVMLSKGELDECDSMLAQGGICVLPEGDDYDSFFEDTMRAGHYENRRESVDIMIRSSRSVINDLVALGVEFNREADGSLAFTREGAHARPRIAFYRDVTGKAITSKLLERVQQLPNVEILDHTAMIDLLVEEGECRGVVACPVTEEQSVRTIDELMPEDAAAPAAGNPAAGDLPAPPLRSMRAPRCWRRAALAASTSIPPTFPSSRATRCIWRPSMALRRSIWTTCRFTPPACIRSDRGARFLSLRAAAARARCCSTRPASALSTSSSRATWWPLPFASRCAQTARSTSG